MSEQPRILLIDDDELDREQVRRLLDDNCDVVEAATAQAGIDALDQAGFDCVLLDYRLPDSTGLDLLPRLVEQNIPVVLLTGQGNASVAVQALKLGAMDYLSKDDLAADALRSSIGNVLERSELQRKLRLKQQELEQFVAVASHDLQSPLRTMSMLCEHLVDRRGDHLDAEALRTMQAIIRDTKRMHALVSSLLEYSRLGRSDLPPTEVDLNDVMLLVEESLRAAIEESGARIEYDSLPTVTSHRVSLVQVLQNLVANGIKFQEEDTAAIVTVTAEVKDSRLHVSVADNGIGIAPEHHEVIFAPFRRLHGPNEYEGSGIGLAACQRVLGAQQFPDGLSPRGFWGSERSEEGFARTMGLV